MQARLYNTNKHHPWLDAEDELMNVIKNHNKLTLQK